MTFTVERDEFADAVTWTARTLPARPAAPALSGLLLERAGSTLSLSAFDYEVAARSQVTVDPGGDSEGERLLLRGRLLADIVRNLPAAPVRLQVDGTRVTLTCGSARFTVPTLPVEDYPALPDAPAASGTIGSDLLATAVTSVAVAAGRDDSLPVLTAVRVEIEGDRITLAATDRYRLAVREVGWSPASPGMSLTALVPARTLSETARTLVAGAEVTIAVSDSIIDFTAADGRRTTSRLLDGQFPAYRALLPNESAATATVATPALIEAVKRVALVAERNAPIRLTFTPDELTLEAGTGEEAQARESLTVDFTGPAAETGEPFPIAFNPTFLLDGLGAVDSDTVRMAFTQPNKPAVLTAAKSEPGGSAGDAAGDAGLARAADSYRYLLMPMRLNG